MTHSHLFVKARFKSDMRFYEQVVALQTASTKDQIKRQSNNARCVVDEQRYDNSEKVHAPAPAP